MGDIDDIDDMSTINGKPVDATANLRIHLYLKECKQQFEKVFGVFLKESNVVQDQAKKSYFLAHRFLFIYILKKNSPHC